MANVKAIYTDVLKFNMVIRRYNIEDPTIVNIMTFSYHKRGIGFYLLKE